MLRSSNNPFTATPRPLLWVSVILASLALRIPGLTESLWFDEVFRTRVILSGESARSVLLYDVHNPLYNAFMFLWIRLFGDSEISIRIPSLIAGYALTLLLYRWARDRFSPLVAQLAAAWLLLAPVPVWYSTEAKNTIFTALLAVLCVTSSDALGTAPRSRRAITRAIVTTLLAIACDFQLLLIILPCWLTLLLESRRTPALPRALSITAANSVVLAAPWAVFKLLHLPSLARDYLGLFHLKQLLWFLCIWLPLGGVVGAPGPNQWPLYVALPALILLPLLAVALREAAATQQGRLVRAAFLLPILFFIAASFLLHAAGDRTRIYQDRNLAVIIPFFPLLLAVGISDLTRPRIRRALSALLVGSALVSSILMLTARAETWTVMAPNPDWRGAAKLIPADTPVISSCSLLPLRYYAPGHTLLELPRTSEPLATLESHLRSSLPSPPTFTLIHNPNWYPLSPDTLAAIDARYPLLSRTHLRSLTIEVRTNPRR